MTALCVIETAACTAIGLTSPSTAAAVRCGVAGFAEYPAASDLVNKPAIVAGPPGIAALHDPVEAMAEMANAVLAQFSNVDSIPIVLVLPEERPGLGRDLAARVAAAVTERFPSCRITLASGGGHAGFAIALQQTQTFLDRNPASVLALVGVDSYLHRETIGWLDKHRQLHATYNAWGFIPGAAAGGCLVCHPQFIRSRSAPPLAVIEAFATDQEEVPIKSEGVCLGLGMTRIVQTMLAGQPEGAVFDTLYCDLNGESYRADELGFMLMRLGRRFLSTSDFMAPADCWGDVGAASLPLYITLASEAAAREYSRGPVSLLLAGSESGLRAGIRLRTRQRSP